MLTFIRFPGQYFDEETGLHYNRFRYYDPGIGRYVSADPIGQGYGVVNLYPYVRSNPVGRIDPHGLHDLSPGFRKKYPKSSAQIDSAKGRLTKKKKDAFKKWSGCSDADVGDAFTPGSGPTVTPDPSQGAGEGSFSPSPGAKDIKIGEDTFKDVEAGKPGAEQELDKALEHETTHYLDNLDSTDTPGEEGWGYEVDVYGAGSTPGAP